VIDCVPDAIPVSNPESCLGVVPLIHGVATTNRSVSLPTSKEDLKRANLTYCKHITSK